MTAARTRIPRQDVSSRELRTAHISQALAECSRALRHRVVRDPATAEVDVPERFATVCGELRGTSVIMSTRRFRTAKYDTLTLAEIVTEAGTQVSLTVVGFSPPSRGLPILGVDLIAVAGALSLVAVDLAPTCPHIWRQLAPPLLRGLHEDTQEFVVHRKRPDFAAETFSSEAYIVGCRPGHELELLSRVSEFLDAYDAASSLKATVASSDDDVAKAMTRWRQSELENRKELNALARMFGAEQANAYLREFLFAEPSTK